MQRREFLKTGFLGGVCLSSGISYVMRAAPADQPDLQSQRRFTEDIQKHRKVDGTLRLLGDAGKPLNGARLRLEQVRHDFLFGCNFFNFERCESPEKEVQYRDRFSALFNYATLGFYWATYEPQRGSPSYDYTDRVLEWTKTRGIACKGHPLVWDHPAASPKWLPSDHAEIKKLSDERVRQIVGRYRGRIGVWDVVNEATHLPDKHNKTTMADWGAALGPVPYTREPLRLAREANPEATLLVNDYRTDPKHYALLETLKADKTKLFDVVGIQSHMHGGVWSAEKTQEICDRYARLGLPLHFTEMTLVSSPRQGGENWGETTPELEERQAERTMRLYEQLFAHPAVEAITWWDFSDYRAWQKAAAGFLRRDMSPKPVYERLLSMVKKDWWTRQEVTTDARGEGHVRVFAGRYRVTGTLPNGREFTREIHLAQKATNRIDISV